MSDVPHSLTLEQAVIGALLECPGDAFDAISDILTESDFYSPRHVRMFRHLSRMISANMAIDGLTFSEQLKSHGDLEYVGGEAYIGQIIKDSPSTTVNTRAYAEKLREMAVLRGMLVAADTIREIVSKHGMTTTDKLAEAEKAIMSISDSGAATGGIKVYTPREMLSGFYQRIEDAQARKPGELSGTDTGLIELNKRTDGWQAGDMVVIAARPSMGKTTLAMNFVEAAVLCQPYPVVVFSMEQQQAQITDRLLSAMSGIDYGKIKKGDLDNGDWARISVGTEKVRTSKLIVCDRGALSPMEMGAILRRVKREHGGIGGIMSDYIQKMRIPNFRGNRNEELTTCSQAIKDFAKEYSCPHICLAQLSKDCERRPDKRPMNSDIRDCGAIEQDADIIIMLYRDEVYHEKSEDRGIAELIITKNRNGKIGTVRTAFDGSIFRFSNLAWGNHE